MSVLGAAEFFLSALLAFLFWKKKLHRRFPCMGAYLALRVVSTPVLWVLFNGNSVVKWQMWLIAYFYGFWAVYIASAVLILFICMEIFRSALAAFSGLMKFGLVIFRWAVLASALVTFSTVSFAHRGVLILPELACRLMRSVSILELCLLAFLCLSMNALQMSIRDYSFGLALGFGLLAGNDLIVSSLIDIHSSLSAPLQFVYQSVILAGLGIWAAYCALPQQARKPVVVAANSTIYRWNEIASALGHKGTNVAVPAAANSFFLSDVEKVVDKVLTRNLRESESES